MDERAVQRWCDTAEAAIADARAALLAATAVEWQSRAAERFGARVEELLAETTRLARRLEAARSLARAEALAAVRAWGAP